MNPRLETEFLGLKLRNPLLVGASPLADSAEVAVELQERGAAAIVMRSLFEEQIDIESRAGEAFIESHGESFAEATSYFPSVAEYVLGPEEYLRQLEDLKRKLEIPVIASLNGVTVGGWTEYAKRMEGSGADALELNFYFLPTDPAESGQQVEDRLAEVVAAVRAQIKIPLAVKLSPFYSSLPNLIRRMSSLGAEGVVIFNRFYQPDIDIEMLEASPRINLSHSSELLLRLRWLAILHGQGPVGLCSTGGVHTPEDLIKTLMAGADTVQIVSLLLRHGAKQVQVLLEGLSRWMQEHEYTDIKQLRGCMSLQKCPDPSVFERANYMRVLQGWQA